MGAIIGARSIPLARPSLAGQELERPLTGPVRDSVRDTILSPVSYFYTYLDLTEKQLSRYRNGSRISSVYAPLFLRPLPSDPVAKLSIVSQCIHLYGNRLLSG